MFTPQLQSTEMERAIQQLAEFMGQQAMKHDEEIKQILKTQNRMIDQLREPREPQERLFKLKMPNYKNGEDIGSFLHQFESKMELA